MRRTRRLGNVAAGAPAGRRTSRRLQCLNDSPGASCSATTAGGGAGRYIVAMHLAVLLTCVSFAQSPRELIKQGNEHFQAGRYAEALEAYDRIGDEPDGLLAAELLHNRAAAHFKLGQFDEARELWVRAAGLRDEAFEAAAHYNLGNCDYADALKAVQGQDANGSLELLDRAARQYRDALKLDPQRLNARANLELAAQLKKQIEEMAQQQPQSQPSSDQERQDQQQGQSSSQPTSQPSESDQQDQDESKSEQEQQQDQSEDQQQDQSQQPDSQPAPESQPSQQQPQPEASEGEDQEQQMVPIRMTKEEAERLLQMVRDAERQRRATLRAREAAKQKSVEKDW